MVPSVGHRKIAFMILLTTASINSVAAVLPSDVISCPGFGIWVDGSQEACNRTRLALQGRLAGNSTDVPQCDVEGYFVYSDLESCKRFIEKVNIGPLRFSDDKFKCGGGRIVASSLAGCHRYTVPFNAWLQRIEGTVCDENSDCSSAMCKTRCCRADAAADCPACDEYGVCTSNLLQPQDQVYCPGFGLRVGGASEENLPIESCERVLSAFRSRINSTILPKCQPTSSGPFLRFDSTSQCTPFADAVNRIVLQEPGRDNSCRHANDETCDEPKYCNEGTDCADCGNCDEVDSDILKCCCSGEIVAPSLENCRALSRPLNAWLAMGPGIRCSADHECASGNCKGGRCCKGGTSLDCSSCGADGSCSQSPLGVNDRITCPNTGWRAGLELVTRTEEDIMEGCLRLRDELIRRLGHEGSNITGALVGGENPFSNLECVPSWRGPDWIYLQIKDQAQCDYFANELNERVLLDSVDKISCSYSGKGADEVTRRHLVGDSAVACRRFLDIINPWVSMADGVQCNGHHTCASGHCKKYCCELNVDPACRACTTSGGCYVSPQVNPDWIEDEQLVWETEFKTGQASFYPGPVNFSNYVTGTRSTLVYEFRWGPLLRGKDSQPPVGLLRTDEIREDGRRASPGGIFVDREAGSTIFLPIMEGSYSIWLIGIDSGGTSSADGLPAEVDQVVVKEWSFNTSRPDQLHLSMSKTRNFVDDVKKNGSGLTLPEDVPIFTVGEAYRIPPLAIIESNSTLSRGTFGQIYYSLSLNAPETFFIQAKSGIMSGSFPAPGIYEFEMLAYDNGGSSTVIEPFVLEAKHLDTVELSNGPNNQGCGDGKMIDGDLFDNEFTCNCSKTQNYGANCELAPLSSKIILQRGIGGGVGGVVVAVGIALSVFLWMRSRAAAKADKDALQRAKEAYGLTEVLDDNDYIELGGNAARVEFFEPDRRGRSPQAEKFTAPEIRFGNSVLATKGLENLMGVDPRRYMFARDKVKVIIDEFAKNGTAEDIANVKSLIDGTFVNPEGEGSAAPGQSEPPLSDFMKKEEVLTASLGLHHVLALRVYTTSTYRSINDPMRSTPPQLPHPFAGTLHYISDGLSKLREVQGRDPDLRTAEMTFWRGMKNLSMATPFLEAGGGSEMACMSTTSSYDVALNFAKSEQPLLFKFISRSFMTHGALIGFLSVYPREQEVLYPPLTYLRLVKDYRMTKDGVDYQVVEVEPIFPK